MSFATKEGFTKCDKPRYVEDGVGRKVMELNPVELQESPEKGVDRETKTSEEEGDEIDSFLSMRGGIVVVYDPYVRCLQPEMEGCKIWIKQVPLSGKPIELHTGD